MKKFLTLIGLLASATSFAHPGHGHSEGFTITHYFVEPEHALALVAITALVVVIAKKFINQFAKS
jgi:hypothetical protein